MTKKKSRMSWQWRRPSSCSACWVDPLDGDPWMNHPAYRLAARAAPCDDGAGQGCDYPGDSGHRRAVSVRPHNADHPCPFRAHAFVNDQVTYGYLCKAHAVDLGLDGKASPYAADPFRVRLARPFWEDDHHDEADLVAVLSVCNLLC